MNDIIRDVFFCDDELLDLLMIPTEERDDIIKFTQKYFTREIASDEIITNEKVRVCYYQSSGKSIGMQVLKKYWNFDIYVKDTELYNASMDMLQARDEMIADKLRELLTDKDYVCQVAFHFEDTCHLYTRMVGYHRFRISFSFKMSF